MNYIKDTIDYLSKFFQWWIIVQPWERGIRTRFGNRMKVLTPGTHFRIPLFDIVYIQEIRLRVVTMPPQTTSTKDAKTMTIVSVVGYSISDICKLYNTLYQPEVTICNMTHGYISDFVQSKNFSELSKTEIENEVMAKLIAGDNGIKYDYFKIVGYAEVRTYRLIQDAHWTQDSLKMNDRK